MAPQGSTWALGVGGASLCSTACDGLALVGMLVYAPSIFSGQGRYTDFFGPVAFRRLRADGVARDPSKVTIRWSWGVPPTRCS